MYNLSEENKRWVEETWAKLESKMSVIAERTDIPIPNLCKCSLTIKLGERFLAWYDASYV